MGVYRTAQIYQNGHVITTDADTAPELRADFCRQCGSKTTTKCPDCSASIRGHYHVDGVISLGRNYAVPAFCHACGKPYPWTAAKLDAARELADELDELTPDEREKLKGTLDDLVRDTPRTQVAGTRFKRIMSKVGTSSASAMRDIIVDVLSETAKKMILG
jgi:hypothetical protein